MEHRQEMSAFVRSYAVNQFRKQFESDAKGYMSQMVANLKKVEEVYRPHRYFKRKTVAPPDLVSRVLITLLEYGHKRENRGAQVGEKGEKDIEQVNFLAIFHICFCSYCECWCFCFFFQNLSNPRHEMFSLMLALIVLLVQYDCINKLGFYGECIKGV